MLRRDFAVFAATSYSQDSFLCLFFCRFFAYRSLIQCRRYLLINADSNVTFFSCLLLLSLYTWCDNRSLCDKKDFFFFNDGKCTEYWRQITTAVKPHKTMVAAFRKYMFLAQNIFVFFQLLFHISGFAPVLYF